MVQVATVSALATAAAASRGLSSGFTSLRIPPTARSARLPKPLHSWKGFLMTAEIFGLTLLRRKRINELFILRVGESHKR